MKLKEILKLENELITVEQLEEIEESACVEVVEHNGLSGNKFYGKQWFSVKLDRDFINESCEDVKEIQVYTE